MSSLEHRGPGASNFATHSSPRPLSESRPSSQGAPLPVTPPYSSGVAQYQASTPNSGVEGSGNSRKIKARERVKVACNHCRSRKIKCDAERPFCTGCVRAKRVCSYDEAKGRGRDRQPRQSRIRHLLRAVSSDSEPGPSYQHQQGANMYANDGAESGSSVSQEPVRASSRRNEHEPLGWSNPQSPGYGQQRQGYHYQDPPSPSRAEGTGRIGFSTNPRSPTFNSSSRINNSHLPDMSPPQHATPSPPSPRSPDPPSPVILHPSTSIDLIPRIRPSRSERPSITIRP